MMINTTMANELELTSEEIVWLKQCHSHRGEHRYRFAFTLFLILMVACLAMAALIVSGDYGRDIQQLKKITKKK